jgi:pimeloyl-ACP methyl ester carboxylesterase
MGYRVSSANVSERLRRFALRLLLYGGAVFLGLPLAFAHVMTRTYRGAVASTPAQGFTQAQLTVDGLRLRAWLSAGRRERPAVVIVHGLGDTLESYTEHARGWRERGHTVLLPDLRGHGGSEGSRTTLGGREREDVRAAMRHLREARLAESGLVLVGHSMGAMAVLRAAADQSDVRAVVVEAPFDTYHDTVALHARLIYGIPGWLPIVPLSIAVAERLVGFDAGEVDGLAAARAIRAPLLAIVDGDDPRMPEAVVRRIVDAHPGPKRLWVAAGASHVGALFHPEYWKQLGDFIAANGL